MGTWFVTVNGKSEGPFETEEVRQGVAAGRIGLDAFVWQEGFAGWQPLSSVAELAAVGGPPPMPPAMPGPPPFGAAGAGAAYGSPPYQAHEIEYQIEGSEMQFVEVELDQGEGAVAEAGAMMYMSDGIVMETVFGDGSTASAGGGLMDKFMGAGKRLLTGESLFCTVFTNRAPGKARIAFASPYPGKIIPIDLRKFGGKMICQKDAFLCAARGVSIGIAFQKKIGVALFGGEGFIMQKLEGDGMCFVHAGGTIVEKELAAGESLRVDTGCLVALTSTVAYDIEFVGGVKSAIFGGEGFFFARLAGPGHIWLQSLPFSRLAGRIHSAAPQTRGGGGSKDEGSILGGIGSLFER